MKKNMKVNEANDLFINMIKSLYSAETKLEKELPGLAKKAGKRI
jgi:ferritin-like metal-binding protein YciE